MKPLIGFPLDDGTSILVEVVESEHEGLARARQTVEKSLEIVQSAVQYILEYRAAYLIPG